MAGPTTRREVSREASRQAEPDTDSARSLFVAKIPERVSEDELRRYFGRLGLTTTHVKFLPQSGRHDTKSAFVDFSRAEDARRAQLASRGGECAVEHAELPGAQQRGGALAKTMRAARHRV